MLGRLWLPHVEKLFKKASDLIISSGGLNLHNLFGYNYMSFV